MQRVFEWYNMDYIIHFPVYDWLKPRAYTITSCCLLSIEPLTSKVQPATNYWTDDVKMTNSADLGECYPPSLICRILYILLSLIQKLLNIPRVIWIFTVYTRAIRIACILRKYVFQVGYPMVHHEIALHNCFIPCHRKYSSQHNRSHIPRRMTGSFDVILPVKYATALHSDWLHFQWHVIKAFIHDYSNYWNSLPWLIHILLIWSPGRPKVTLMWVLVSLPLF